MRLSAGRKWELAAYEVHFVDSSVHHWLSPHSTCDLNGMIYTVVM